MKSEHHLENIQQRKLKIHLLNNVMIIDSTEEKNEMASKHFSKIYNLASYIKMF